MRVLRETPDGHGLRPALAVSRYNETITRGLLDGALAALKEAGVAESEVTVVHVPGALELPLVAAALARSGRHDAVIALGAVIEGETDHYAHVCAETARGLMDVALATGVPVANGVLTCRQLSHARDRSGPTPKNKGGEAVRAALESARLLARLRDGHGEPRP